MTPPEQTAVIIVAAGKGLRAGGDVAKQWQMLRGKTVAERTISIFRDCPLVGPIIVVLHRDEMAREFVGAATVAGGSSRSASVRAGLDALRGRGIKTVLIHDVARPLVRHQVIEDVLRALEDHQAAAPALAVTDALWRGADNRVTGTQDREGLYRAQTPQGFDYKTICDAYKTHSDDAADDVAIARAAGVDVVITQGDPKNLKLTWAADFARAEEILRGNMDIRLGNGYDVHKFGPGDHVILCGVRVAHDAAMVGHSDADVAMHAVTDAIYGALAEGDIGRHFPPSDPQWKGADSAIFLKHAVELAAQRGFKVGNIDVTIVCEMPKIGPHAAAMMSRMAEIMGLEKDRVSVKATTSEKLGFTGRGEGIASLATATLIRP